MWVERVFMFLQLRTKSYFLKKKKRCTVLYFSIRTNISVFFFLLVQGSLKGSADLIITQKTIRLFNYIFIFSGK